MGFLELSRAAVLSFRRRTNVLDQRLPREDASLRSAAWAGLQDSVPRAAVLSMHARIRDIDPAAWEDDAFVQLWGPRFNAYVVPARDRGVFTLGRLPEGAKRERAESLAARLAEHLDGGAERYGQAGRALGLDPNQLRRAAATGTVLIRWDGARQPTVWSIDAPDLAADDARRELARRYLHVLGPGTPASFATWAGISARLAATTFEALADELIATRTPIGESFLLATDEEAVREEPAPTSAVRLLPSGDAYTLLWGADRDLLVEDPAHRDALWTSRVWPGAVLVAGEIVGSWRRAEHRVRIEAFAPLTARTRAAIEAEAATLPLPDLERPIEVDLGP